jgi:flagellar hook-length control protein FliK
MSAISIDNLMFSAAEPLLTDTVNGNPGDASSSFGDYLMQAQTQSAGEVPQSSLPASLPASPNVPGNSDPSNYENSLEPTASQSQSSSSATQQSALSTDSQPPVNHSSLSSGHSASTPNRPAQSANSGKADSSPPTSNDQNTPTNPQDNQDSNSQDSAHASSHETPATSDAGHQAADPKKAGKQGAAEAAVTTGFIPTVAGGAQAAGGAQVAGANPGTAAQPATSPAHGGKASTPGNAPQNVSATSNARTIAAATVVPPSIAPQIQTADSASPVGPAVPTAAAPAAATPAAPGQGGTAGQDSSSGISPATAAVANSGNTSAAAIPAAPAASAPPPASSPQAAVVGGTEARAGGATPAADSASAATSSIDANLAPDIPTLREQRATSAVDSLSQPDSSSPSATTKPSATNSSSTAALPQPGTPGTASASSGTTTAASPDTNLSQADRVRFVQRVEQAFQDLSGPGGSIRLRLSPPELGSLRIDISVAKGILTARVEAETPAARNVLLDNLPALRERLAQHDIKVQRFDVDLMDRSGSGASNQSSYYQDSSSRNTGQPPVRTAVPNSQPAAAAIEAASARPVSSSERLNVVV